jgi:hypothetical protein
MGPALALCLALAGFDPALRGVALEDLGDATASAIAVWLRLPDVLPANAVLSTSLVAVAGKTWIVDAVVRAPHFTDSDTRRHPRGRVGAMRVRIDTGDDDARCALDGPEPIWERSLIDLDLRYHVTIGDWTAVIEDATLGFRRVYPIGGGGIDRGVRVAGVLTSMTPTTEDGRLEKTWAWRELRSPWYFRGRPYLPVSIARGIDPAHKYYVESMVAFHIWQDKGFERGYFSHGCMRMRDADLDELAAFVFGAARPIPTTLRIGPMPDARHPYPLERTRYWQLKNFGTAARPRPHVVGILYEMERGTLPLPELWELVPMSFDDEPLAAPREVR